MWTTGLLVIFVFFILFFLFTKYMENTIIHVETGKSLPSESFLGSIYSIFFHNGLSQARRLALNHQKHGVLFGKWQFMFYQVSTCSPQLAKKILTDSKTFSKPDAAQQSKILPHSMKPIFNPKSVLLAEGEEWKDQRKSIDLGFYDLSIYSNVFMDKAKEMIKGLEKEPIVDDIHDNFQKMAL
jgi:cytochrome P450